MEQEQGHGPVISSQGSQESNKEHINAGDSNDPSGPPSSAIQGLERLIAPSPQGAKEVWGAELGHALPELLVHGSDHLLCQIHLAGLSLVLREGPG